MTSSEQLANGWRIGPRLTTPLTPTTVLAHADGSGVAFGFSEGPGQRLEERRALVVGIDGAGVGALLLDEPGWIVSAHAIGDRLVALRGRPGPIFDLWCSADGGRTWALPQPGPSSSLTSVLAIGPEHTWALGARTLGRWRAGTWQDIPPPAPVNPTLDRLFAVDGIPVLATPTGLHLWREDRLAWGHRSLDGAHVRGLASPFVAARGPKGVVRLGQLTQAWVDWLGEIEGGADIAAMSWASRRPGHTTGGRAMQLLLVPHAPDVHRGLVLVRSAPEGGLRVERIAVPPAGSWAGVCGARGVLALTADRRPLQCGETT